MQDRFRAREIRRMYGSTIHTYIIYNMQINWKRIKSDSNVFFACLWPPFELTSRLTKIPSSISGSIEIKHTAAAEYTLLANCAWALPFPFCCAVKSSVLSPQHLSERAELSVCLSWKYYHAYFCGTSIDRLHAAHRVYLVLNTCICILYSIYGSVRRIAIEPRWG